MLDDNRGLAVSSVRKTDTGELVEVIRMQSLPADCWGCGSPEATGSQCGIPVYEDLILPNDWEGEWGGVPACPACFEKQSRLTAPMSLLEFSRKESP